MGKHFVGACASVRSGRASRETRTGCAVDVEPKRAAISLDEVGDQRLSEISAADFLQVLEQAEALGQQTRPEEVTVRDAVVGARAAFRLPSRGGFPEKKKVEREKQHLEKEPEKLAPEKGFEGFPEKKKVELEKVRWEGSFDKVKADNEQPIELAQVAGLADRLTAIEEKLSQQSS